MLQLKRIWLLAVFSIVGGISAGQAQPYRFQVRSLKLEAYPQTDASVRLEYEITFRNEPGAHPIDIVDVGLPHSGYRIGSMTASIDGHPVEAIQRSSYIDVGVEVDLGIHAIGPGDTGVFRFSCVMPEMVYADTTDKEYASVQIRPTWFDPQLQTGSTNLQVAIHVPPGITASELRYQDDKQRYSDLVENFAGPDGQPHAVAIWQSPQHQLSDRNPKFSLSFPRRVMQRVVEKSTWDLLVEWFEANPQLQFYSGAILVALLAFAFFRFSHGTGFVLFAILAMLLVVGIMGSAAMHLLCWPIVVGLCALNEWYLGRRKAAPSYLPAMATVEGGGIKRGLTAPQAAVLLELPLPKVMSLVIFGMLKKKLLECQSNAPLTVKVPKNLMVTRSERLKRASQEGIVIHDYEHPFLDALMMHEGPVEKCNLNSAMGDLVKSVVERMKGFDLQATREYYQRIVKRAWTEAESIGEIAQREDAVERNFEWMMMDPDWTILMEDWRRRGYEYRPRWSRRDFPGSTTTIPVPTGGGSSSTPSAPGSAPTLSEVAGSFAGWAESTTGRFASMLEPASMGLDIPKGGGVVDLSVVDRVTGDVFQALAEAAEKGGSRGGGGGGGCACACAGCACACACAGGGR